MVEFLGAKQITPWSELNKRDFLLFDRLVTTSLESNIRQHLNRDTAAELEWLASEGLLVETDKSVLKTSFEQLLKTDLGLAAVAALYAIAPHLALAYHRARPTSNGDSHFDHRWLAVAGIEFNADFCSRFIAAGYPSQDIARITPLMNSSHTMRHLDFVRHVEELRTVLKEIEPGVVEAASSYPRYRDLAAHHRMAMKMAGEVLEAHREEILSRSATDVVQVALEALPVPDETTPWEQLLDFKRDADVEHSLKLCRRWIRKCAEADKKPIEIREELEDLVADYTSTMRRHRLKFRPGLIETTLCVSAELAENILKLQWGKAAQALFKVRQNRLSLLDAEVTAPGREVAFIVRARERFGRR